MLDTEIHDDSVNLSNLNLPSAPGTYRVEVDTERRDPTRLAIVEAQLAAQRDQAETQKQLAQQREDEAAERRAKILGEPRFSRPGWLVIATVEIIAACFALAVLTNSAVGFTWTTVLFASACFLIPNAVIGVFYTAADADIRKKAREVTVRSSRGY